MKKKTLFTAFLFMGLFCALTGCAKKDEADAPTEQTLTPVSLDQLEEGCFYVRNEDKFWKLPLEECNFDTSEAPVSTDGSQAGFVETGLDKNRIVDFVYEDDAIPTLYKNDTLIYVTNEAISSFTWERYLDCGYSIGIYGFSLNNSDKITTGDLSTYSPLSSITAQLSKNQIPNLGGIVFDKINGTPLSKSYLNESAGIITGMSKNANAQIDAFIGTTHVPMTASADTRYFQAFELYNSTKYSLSTDGYAIIEIPNYLKSGYYLLNNKGFVKFVNIDRGNDESSIDMTVPYYYKDEDGKTLTYYEWRESQGLEDDIVTKEPAIDGTVDISDYPERMKLTIDSSAVGLNVNVNYTYQSETAQQSAAQTGEFPRAVLMDPLGNVTALKESDQQNSDGSYTISTSMDTAPSGDWYLLFRNFENTYKNVSTEVLSGNATTYIHNGQSGSINIYYEAAAMPQTLHITWEQTDRTATGVELTDPNNTKYSLEKNPEMFNNYAGGVDIALPSMSDGTYRIDLKGDTLGRVWVTRENAQVQPETTNESSEASSEASPEAATEEAEETTESSESTVAADSQNK